MTTWFTADEHYGHKSIIHHANRPFRDTFEMDDALVLNHNAVVGKKDLVYHIGDFAWRHHNRYLSRLNGRHVLVRGSHDKMPEGTRKNWTQVYGYESQSARGFCKISVDGSVIVLCHYKMYSWPSSHHNSYHLHGHSHGRLPETIAPCCDVGVDVWDFTPVPWEVLKMKLDSKMAEWRERAHRSLMEIDAAVEMLNLSNRLWREAWSQEKAKRES